VKVLLVADLEEWILGHVARHLAPRLAGRAQVNVLYSRSSDFLRLFEAAQKRYDVVHFLSSSDIIDFGRFTYIPCVATLWHMVHWAAFEAVASRIDALFVCSEQWREKVSKHISPALPVRRMRPGLDTAHFARQPEAKRQFIQQMGLSQDTLVFGFAGSGWSNEGQRKGVDRLWSCFGQLKNTLNRSFVLRLLGPHWPANIVPEPLRPWTRFDVIDSPLLPQFYSSLDYYVCTSRVEGGPYPVLEAMSCECAVLSTPVGVVPEILRHGENGFLLQEDSFVSDFLDAVRHTAEHPEFRRRCGRNAREQIVRSYSWDVTVDASEFVETYQAAMHRFGARSALQRKGYRLDALAYTRYRQARAAARSWVYPGRKPAIQARTPKEIVGN
jgi:glycosyltransferase involved in cell wall biosynthesis